jgi:hypothetical protein
MLRLLHVHRQGVLQENNTIAADSVTNVNFFGRKKMLKKPNNVQQLKRTYNFRNMKEKLLKTNIVQ